MASEENDCRVQPSRDSLAKSGAIWRRPCIGECSEKQFVSVCVCARVFIFPGHVFFHATVSSPKKQVPNCTRVDWDKLADCPCSGQQRLAEMLESLSGTTGCRRNRKNAMCWQGAKEPQCVGVGVGDSHRMLSFNSNRSSQQDTEQGTITDVLGLHMLTSTLDCFFVKSLGSMVKRWPCQGGSCLLWQEEKIAEHLSYHHNLLTPDQKNWSGVTVISRVICTVTDNV